MIKDYSDREKKLVFVTIGATLSELAARVLLYIPFLRQDST